MPKEALMSPVFSSGPVWLSQCIHRFFFFFFWFFRTVTQEKPQEGTELRDRASEAHQVPFHCQQGEQDKRERENANEV